MSRKERTLEIVILALVLLVGGGLRLVRLADVPPGLTHDEADHGLDAAGVLEGRTPLYFTVGYGREPLFDYVTAPVMLLVGRSYLASRLTAVLFGLGLIALLWAWVRRATQNPWLALASAAGLAVSFWGVSTSRQALRSVTLPVLYMAAALLMWHGLRIEEDEESEPPPRALRHRPRRWWEPEWPTVEVRRMWYFVLAGALLGLSMYTYLAARIMWVVFPAFFIFLSLSQPGVIRQAWRGLVVMLLVAAAVAAPLFVYLGTHPGAEARLGQLSGPVDALLSGDFEPLRRNIRVGLGMITVQGDDLWLYNIPGKPLLGPWMSLLFYLGVSVAVLSLLHPYRPARRGRRSYDEAFRVSSANAFMLFTLAVGIVPALVTGIGASMTRVIGMQPALFYFPALAVVWRADGADRRVGPEGETALWVAYAVGMVVVAGLTIYNYFEVWANARDVRVAYHTTLVETLRYLDDHPEIGPDMAMSTITPGRFHDPAVAEMVLRRDDLNVRWFDGRTSWVYPDAERSVILWPELAAPDPAFVPPLEQHGQPLAQIHLRPGDFNHTVTLIRWDGGMLFDETPVEPVLVGGVLRLVGYTLSAAQTRPGDTLEIVTAWQVEGQAAGEIVLFTHALDESNQVVAQQDVLGVPSWDWFVGDQFVQLHRFTIPDIPPGTLRIEIGAYTRPDIARLPLTSPGGEPLGSSLVIATIEVTAP